MFTFNASLPSQTYFEIEEQTFLKKDKVQFKVLNIIVNATSEFDKTKQTTKNNLIENTENAKFRIFLVHEMGIKC